MSIKKFSGDGWIDACISGRSTGRTSAMIKACASIRAVLVVRSFAEVQRIKTVSREKGDMVRAVSIDTLKDSRVHNGRPVLFDPDALGIMFMDYERALRMAYDRIDELQKRTI